MSVTELGSLTVTLLIIIAGAHGLGYLFVRIRQPRVVGEILAGVVLGPSLLGRLAPEAAASLFGAASPRSTTSVVLSFLYWLGLLMLMLISGAGVRKVLGSRETRRRTAWILGVGTSLPFLVTLTLSRFLPLSTLMGPARRESSLLLVLSIAVAVTSIPMITKVFADLGILQSRFASLVLGVAVLEDIILWGVLAVATALATSTAVAEHELATTIPLHAGISLAYMGAGLTLAPAILRRLSAARFNILAAASPLGWVMVTLFTYTAIAAVLDVNLVFAAFLAGFGIVGGFSGSERRRFADSIDSLSKFSFATLIPIYFAVVGYRLDLNKTFSLGVLALFLAGSTVLRTVSVALGARCAGFRRLDLVNLAVVANDRGGPGIVLASVAFDAGIISPGFFTSLVLTAILTCQMAGFWLGYVLRKGWPLLSGSEDVDSEEVDSEDLEGIPEHQDLNNVLHRGRPKVLPVDGGGPSP